MDKKRFGILAAASLIQNANLKGFFTGKIYQGPIKNVCVPGLNCYSCPGAVGSCPIGSLQGFLSGLKFRFPYYVVGLLLFFGAVLGRAVCGLLCPFGFLQELLNLIPGIPKKNRFKGDQPLRYLKYIVLVVLVIVLPLCFALTPFFCKYLCPSGTIAGILLSLPGPVGWHLPMEGIGAGADCGRLPCHLAALLQIPLPPGGHLWPVQQIRPVSHGF